jgi:hypothetical protein
VAPGLSGATPKGAGGAVADGLSGVTEEHSVSERGVTERRGSRNEWDESYIRGIN